MHLTVSNMLDGQIICLILQVLCTSSQNRNFDMQYSDETLEKMSETSVHAWYINWSVLVNLIYEVQCQYTL